MPDRLGKPDDLFEVAKYFHGDNGAGIGASHQTGWTGLVARFIQLFDAVDGPGFLEEAVTVALNRGQ
jgi:hypothetical protein